MIRRPPRSTLSSSSAASDVYKRQGQESPAVDARRTMSATVAGDTRTAPATCLAESPLPSLSLSTSLIFRTDSLLFPIAYPLLANQATGGFCLLEGSSDE